LPPSVWIICGSPPNRIGLDVRILISNIPLCLPGLLGLTLLASPVTAQVFDSGPSDPALFDTVINIPSDPDIGDNASIDGDGFRL